MVNTGDLIKLALIIVAIVGAVMLLKTYTPQLAKDAASLKMIGGGEDEAEMMEEEPVAVEAEEVVGEPEAVSMEQVDAELVQAIQQDNHVVNDQIDYIDNAEESRKASQDELVLQNKEVLPRPQMSNNSAPQGTFGQNYGFTDCFPADQLNSKDLLPQEDANGGWGEAAPKTQGSLSYTNFVEATHHFGVNTVGNSLRNANLQIRSDPIIEKKEVGPWQNSTYTADTTRKQFEIGMA